MGERSNIEWTDATWNPIRGCTRVSEGCRHCYAEALASRYSAPGLWGNGIAKPDADGRPRWTGEVVLVEKRLPEPLKWREPRRIFVNSLSDLFHEKLAFEDVDRVFNIMAQARQHTFQVLTKRPQRMLEYMNRIVTDYHGVPGPIPLPNVWLGVSAENQAAADERVPILLQTAAQARFVSAEPLIGPIDFTALRDDEVGAHWNALEPLNRRLDWIIVGGESGPGHREMKPAWLRDIVAQAQSNYVPVFVKQDSGPRPGQQGRIPDYLWAAKEFPS